MDPMGNLAVESLAEDSLAAGSLAEDSLVADKPADKQADSPEDSPADSLADSQKLRDYGRSRKTSITLVVLSVWVHFSFFLNSDRERASFFICACS